MDKTGALVEGRERERGRRAQSLHHRLAAHMDTSEGKGGGASLPTTTTRPSRERAGGDALVHLDFKRINAALARF